MQLKLCVVQLEYVNTAVCEPALITEAPHFHEKIEFESSHVFIVAFQKNKRMGL